MKNDSNQVFPDVFPDVQYMLSWNMLLPYAYV